VILLGIVLGAAAAGCFDGAVALQALEARTGPGVVRLIKRPRWLAATALAIAGWPLQVAALAVAPLAIVQPSLAFGLVLLLFLGVRMLGEPARPRDFAAVAAIAAALGLLAWAAPEEGHADTTAAAIAIGGSACIATLPWLARFVLPSPAIGWAFIFAAGCGYAGSGLGTALMTGSSFAWAVPTAAVAGVALLGEMAALQRQVASRVAAGAFALQTAVPVLLAPAVTGEHWTHPVAMLAALAVVLAASLGLGAAAPVRRLIAH
jgi:hypothetical protein